MATRTTARLSSVHLEDLAHIVLSARTDGEVELYPDLADDVRARLRSRIKHVSRYDWPSTLAEDPLLRRGYTLRQCLRMAFTLPLLEAYVPPSVAVTLVRDNEVSLFRSAAARLADPGRSSVRDDDELVVFLPAEIGDALGLAYASLLDPARARRIRRDRLMELFESDLAGPGPRLIVDIPVIAAGLWRWLSDRRLLPDAERLALLAEIEEAADAPGHLPKSGRTIRR